MESNPSMASTDVSVIVSIVLLKLWYMSELPSQNSHFPFSLLEITLLL